ncbi:MAG: SipW-dependent-type signal peptide-containing protein [Oscillospiraceae bacterium]
MKKKTILVAAIAVMLVAALVVGGTLAYFTDKDNATNTFTVGNVSIDLIEQQRQLGENGNKTTELEAFKSGQSLYPIVGSAQGEKDALGMPIAKNYVDKMVTIKNTGSEKAYIRAYFAIPSALDDGYETFNAGKNVLHFNFGNKVENGVITSTEGNEWKWTHGSKWNYFETTIGDIKYNVYYADYYQALDAHATTEQLVQGVYLDKSFDMKADGAYAFGQKLALDEGWDWNNVTCPVYAVAVQAEGFDSASAAMDAAFGAQYNPWGTPATNWQ